MEFWSWKLLSSDVKGSQAQRGSETAADHTAGECKLYPASLALPILQQGVKNTGSRVRGTEWEPSSATSSLAVCCWVITLSELWCPQL